MPNWQTALRFDYIVMPTPSWTQRNKMRKRELEKIKLKLKNCSIFFLVSLVLLVIDIMLVYFNGPYYGNWFKKYISHLTDDTIWPKSRLAAVFSFITALVFELATLYKYVYMKIENSKKKKGKKTKTHKN